MKVHVYVEGPSDRAALQALLKPIIEQANNKGIGINFHPMGSKSAILDDVPGIAANSEAYATGLPVV